MALEHDLKVLLIEELKIRDMTPDQLADDEPLFGGGVGLDSLDAFEVVMILKKHFGIEIQDRNEARRHLESVGSIAAYIRARGRD